MSKKQVAPELTRRNFLASSMAAMGLAAAGCMIRTDQCLAQAEEDSTEEAKDASNPEEKVAHTFHQYMCGGGCSLKCTTRDGRLCKIEPNDAWNDPSLATVCARGISEI